MFPTHLSQLSLSRSYGLNRRREETSKYRARAVRLAG